MRYLVVSQVCAARAAGIPTTQAVGEVAGRTHLDREGRPRRVAVRTLWRWLGRWESAGFDGLRTELRQRPGSGLPESFLAFLEERKGEDPTVSIPEVIRHARVIGVISDDATVDRTTVWRECHRLGLPTRRRCSSKRSMQRPWRYPHRMQCVLADGKHFKAGGRRAARVAVLDSLEVDPSQFVQSAGGRLLVPSENGLEVIAIRDTVFDDGFETGDLSSWSGTG